MEFHLEHMDEKRSFDVKLQIALYKTALKVMDESRREEFESYIKERVEKLHKILGVDEKIRIFENGILIFEG
ncbi:MAG: hypothetical protein J7L63_06285 [Thermoplasmata archaeon]|nr:hypothetical protein [Thermoplasmata archaeon]